MLVYKSTVPLKSSPSLQHLNGVFITSMWYDLDKLSVKILDYLPNPLVEGT